MTRAPGRLDVMGGIADYSGSLVLQLPLREACHVAAQRHPLHKQRLWRHIAARHVSLRQFAIYAKLLALHCLHQPADREAGCTTSCHKALEARPVDH